MPRISRLLRDGFMPVECPALDGHSYRGLSLRGCGLLEGKEGCGVDGGDRVVQTTSTASLICWRWSLQNPRRQMSWLRGGWGCDDCLAATDKEERRCCRS